MPVSVPQRSKNPGFAYKTMTSKLNNSENTVMQLATNRKSYLFFRWYCIEWPFSVTRSHIHILFIKTW